MNMGVKGATHMRSARRANSLAPLVCRAPLHPADRALPFMPPAPYHYAAAPHPSPTRGAHAALDRAALHTLQSQHSRRARRMRNTILAIMAPAHRTRAR